MEKERQRIDIDRENQSARRTSCPGATCPPEIIHRLPLQRGFLPSKHTRHIAHIYTIVQGDQKYL
jgi:hypothetical protein